MESATTQAIAKEYDHFQTSFEEQEKEQKYLNYGYTVSKSDTYEERQERLVEEVFKAADIQPDDVVIDVGFGSGEQDFLLLRTRDFKELHGFNISEKQVEYATKRAGQTEGGEKLNFHHGEAEALAGLEPESANKVMAIECAFYFDRPRFYARAAEVLKPGGRLILADISFRDGAKFLTRSNEGRKRAGHRSENKTLWEKHFKTISHTDISRETRPGAWMSAKFIHRAIKEGKVKLEEVKSWKQMAKASQLVAIGLLTGFVHYDLFVLEKPAD
ncbi:MAG: methyltransferase domain-containing protein [Verrucomicrobiota bacterium]